MRIMFTRTRSSTGKNIRIKTLYVTYAQRSHSYAKERRGKRSWDLRSVWV